MNVSRLAAWMFGAAVCGAWLASAAGVPRPIAMPRIPQPSAADLQVNALAIDVQQQASRLRDRLANAPAPRLVDRNPFSFPVRRLPVERARSMATVPDVQPAVPPAPIEPVLTLIGVAEHLTPDGVVRTAMMTGSAEDLIMATAGQRILGRYDLVVVSVDAVELRDVETGTIRRLVLKQPL